MKIVVQSTNNNYIAIETNFWKSVAAAFIAQIDMDEAWYLKQYPDVLSAMKAGMLRDARQHYIETGYFEHRMPYLIETDSEWYLAQYPDVSAAVEQKVFQSAQEHFEESGFREGRFPFPNFALRQKSGDGK
jgi:hypothetical protein